LALSAKKKHINTDGIFFFTGFRHFSRLAQVYFWNMTIRTGLSCWRLSCWSRAILCAHRHYCQDGSCKNCQT